MSRPMNLVAPTLCPDPECSEFDRCNEFCACPNCSPRDAAHRDIATAAWIALAPVAEALNGTDTYWSWSRAHSPSRVSDFMLELTDTVQVYVYGGEFVVQEWQVSRPATYIDPEDGEWTDMLATTDPIEAAERALILTKENS